MLAVEPGRGPGPNHYSVLKGTTTLPAKVCGLAGWEPVTLDSQRVNVHSLYKVCV